MRALAGDLTALTALPGLSNRRLTKRNLAVGAAGRGQRHALLVRLAMSQADRGRPCGERVFAAVTLKLGDYSLVARDPLLALGHTMFSEV